MPDIWHRSNQETDAAIFKIERCYEPMNKARLKAALRRLDCPANVINEATRELRILKDKARELEMWIKFHDRKIKLSEYAGDEFLFCIEDGGTHWVVAKTKNEALDYHVKMSSYKTLDELVDDMGECEITKEPGDKVLSINIDEPDEPDAVIKTCAEWCYDSSGTIPYMLATSEY